MKELLINQLNFFGLAWWVEIATATPCCTYYFGPFLSAQEAVAAQAGYIEDLEDEGAQGLRVVIKRCKPSVVTISEEFGKLSDLGGVRPAFSIQP